MNINDWVYVAFRLALFLLVKDLFMLLVVAMCISITTSAFLGGRKQ